MKNLEDEFMHGYVMPVVGLHAIAFDLITAVYNSCSLKLDEETLKKVEARIKEKTINYDKFVERLMGYIDISKELDWIISDKKSELSEPSDLFKTNLHLNNIIVCSAGDFQHYLENNNQRLYPSNFREYSSSLSNAYNSIEGALKIMNVYNSLIDGVLARTKWIQSHPEFTEGKWKPSE